MNYNQFVKEDFQAKLVANNDLEAARKKAALALYDPLFEPRFLHPEDKPVIRDFNNMMLESLHDLTILHHEVMCGATAIKNLSDSIEMRLSVIQKKLLKEKEIRDDIKLLCGAYTIFDNVIAIDDAIEIKQCDEIDGAFRALSVSEEKVAYITDDLVGNGLAGNDYVLDGEKFLKDTVQNDKLQAIYDSNKQTFFDYQRIIIDNSEIAFSEAMQKDQVPVRMTLTCKADKYFNECVVSSDRKDLKLTELRFSEDGLKYNNLLQTPLMIAEDNLSNINYIARSGRFVFPSARYVQFLFEGTLPTQDKIGFQDKSYVEPSDAKTFSIVQKITPVLSAKRYLIRLNELGLTRNLYSDKSYFKTGNLLKYPVKAVALYANTYIPSYFKPDKYLTYLLSVNGKEYEITPINNQDDGIKIIKTSEMPLDNLHNLYISDPIKDVRLTVIFKCPSSYETPYISRMRLLIGERYV